MKKILVLTLFLLLFFPSILVEGQSKIENRQNFYEAESWILYEDYDEALPLYLRLGTIFPNNYNYKYRIGQCYINIPGEKEKAMAFLEEAVKNINPKYKEGKYKEKGAPFDAWYYLANAYRINNYIDKAIETYNIFKADLDNKVYDSTIINMQIQSCYNAKNLMESPLYVRYQNLGELINDDNSDYQAVVSPDESILVYVKQLAFYDAVMYSTKVDGKWSAPINMNEMLMIDRDIYPTSISSDGKTIYFYSSANYDGVLSTSTFENGTWGPLVRLNDNINTKYWESHAAISHDNNHLYFTSNRKGTLGGLDIFVSTRDSITGEWGVPVNMGPSINTPCNEESPFISKDGKTLFFSSVGHFNMGSYDIFYSTLMDDGQWSPPLNVGYPMNTTDDNVFFVPINDGYEGYYSREDSSSFGKQDIYHVEMFSDLHPRKFAVSGTAKLNNRSKVYDGIISVRVVDDEESGNEPIEVLTDSLTGRYTFEVPQGRYEITYESPKGQTIKKELVLALDDPSDIQILDDILMPVNDYVAEMNVESDRSIVVLDGEEIVIPIQLEKNSSLSAQTYQLEADQQVDSLINETLVKEEFFENITDSIYYYRTVPPQGESKIVFTATDQFGNKTTTEVFITKKVQPTVSDEEMSYKHTVSKDLMDKYTELQERYADERISALIKSSDLDEQSFASFDEEIAYLKERAKENNIDPESIDEMALKIAKNDNILTQAAVDLLEKYADGELKEILQGIDIQEQNLKTWDDLLKYIEEKSEGRITAEDVNALADSIVDKKALSDAVAGGELTQAAVEMLANEATGELKDILEGVDVNALGLKTWDDLLKYIEEKSEGRITAEDVNALANNILHKQELKTAINGGALTQGAVDLLAEYATGELKTILENTDIDALGIKTWEELLKYIEQQSEGRITGDEVTALANNILYNQALLDGYNNNELTQATVDLLAKYADGELKDILEDIDVEKLGLKTWDDLLKYIEEKSEGRITSDDVNALANGILFPDDPLNSMKSKIITYTTDSALSDIYQQAFNNVETMNITDQGEWLKAFSEEALRLGVSEEELAKMLAALTSSSDDDVFSFRDELASFAEEPFATWLRSIDLDKERIDTPAELLLYILKNMQQAGFDSSLFYDAIANMLDAKNIPPYAIKESVLADNAKKGSALERLWWLWLILLLGVGYFIVKRKMNNKKGKKDNR